MRLFHYHLVVSEPRSLEARYLGRLGFRLQARYGRVGGDYTTVEPGTSWEELDRMGFKLSLSELERGAVSVVVAPGQSVVPRVDHLGVVLDEEGFQALVERVTSRNLPVQERGGRRMFVSTSSGYRVEVHPPRDWIDDLLSGSGELELTELRLRTERPQHEATILADILGLDVSGDSVEIGHTIVRFVPGGAEGRPELNAERFR